jgi:polyisoprenoid-binding protein YceI
MNLQDSYISKTKQRSHAGYPDIKLAGPLERAIKVSVTVWSRTDVIKDPALSNCPRRQIGAYASAFAACIASLAWASALCGEPRAIDTAKSVMTVRVYKAGVLGALGHDHEIAAQIATGSVDPTGHHVEFHTKASALKVHDKGGSDKDRAEIQSTMLGPEVLDAEKHPEIVFRSTGVESGDAGSWKVAGNLTLHGQTRAVTVEVREAEGHYVGACRFKQTEFGIKPVKVGGGTIRVKDEVRVEFDLQLAR